MNISFSKYSGLGNDFIFIDDRDGLLDLSSEEIFKLCHRKLGIGADGLVLLQNSNLCDYKMRIFNADGFEAEMCGNALRCLFSFIQEVIEDSKDELLIETFDRQLKIRGVCNLVECEMGPPKNLKLDMKIALGKDTITGHYVDTGVPHFVIFSEHLEALDVASLGEKISHHSAFAPQRCNVNFIQIDSDQKVHIRTFERGVEAETLACGTGAAAAALITHLKLGLSEPIEVYPSLKGKLSFKFQESQNKILNILMTGPSKYVFRGNIELSLPLLKE